MTRQVIMVFYGKARWHDARTRSTAPTATSSRTRARRSCSLPLVVLAGLAIVGGVHQPAVQPRHRVPRRSGSSRSSSSPSTSVDGRRKTAARAHGDRHRRWRSSASLLGVLVYAKHKVKAVEPEVLAEGWYYDADRQRLHGRARARGVRGRRLVRREHHRRRGQRRRRRGARGRHERIRTRPERQRAQLRGGHRRRRGRCVLAWFVVVRGNL